MTPATDVGADFFVTSISTDTIIVIELFWILNILIRIVIHDAICMNLSSPNLIIVKTFLCD